MFKKTIHIIFLILFPCILYCKGVETEIKTNSGGFNIKLILPEEKFTEKKGEHFIERNYLEFSEESRTGSFILPSKTITFAIPPYSKPKISIKNYKIENIKKSIPAINKSIQFLNDSTLTYSESKEIYDDMVEQNNLTLDCF